MNISTSVQSQGASAHLQSGPSEVDFPKSLTHPVIVPIGIDEQLVLSIAAPHEIKRVSRKSRVTHIRHDHMLHIRTALPRAPAQVLSFLMCAVKDS